MKRKDFIQISTLASGSLFIPRFLQAAHHYKVPKGNKVLVVLQLSGGNDGLNTIIPYTNDEYYKLRPTISIKKDKALRLTDDAGINPNLSFFKELYDDGSLAIINNVGYPNPNRSHFRSMDIWHSASNANEYVETGWLGRYLDAACKNCEKPTQILELDDLLSLAMKGDINKGLAFQDVKKLYNNTQENYFKALYLQKKKEQEEVVDYLYKTLGSTLNSAEYIFNQAKAKKTKANYPISKLGRKMETIASLIFSDINTKVYYVSIGSFDTHIGQENTQRRLFTEINNAVQAFVKDLKTNGRFEDVLLMTFSEFGRRVKQNASNGTDHGTANQMMMISGALKQKGLVNKLPNLNDLQDGDLKHDIDFRQVYATILKKWLGANEKEILKQSFSLMDFI